MSETITHNELIDIGRRWLIKSYAACAPYGHYGCTLVLTELCAGTRYGEQPDVLGYSTKTTILIECKTSRSDFYAEKDKPFRLLEEGIGGQRWYLAPKGIIPIEALPAKWGLLEVTPDKKIHVSKHAELQPRDFHSEMIMLISTIRRLNINPDGHVAISKYDPPEKLGFKPSKKKATFYISEEEEE
ncbi:MAG: hypothetical protein LBC76_08160 [Treponema sp.]|jgi:Holliday junction resolvase|nr:hypothetical protein [Treponema sp.]